MNDFTELLIVTDLHIVQPGSFHKLGKRDLGRKVQMVGEPMKAKKMGSQLGEMRDHPWRCLEEQFKSSCERWENRIVLKK